jgi:DNA ligase-1
MLATDAELDKLRFPLLASAKLDGVRAVVRGGTVYSRSNKPIPNVFVQNLLDTFEHLDGELIVGEPTSKTVYRDTVSHVMSQDKVNYDLRFYVFDHVRDLSAPYLKRNLAITNEFYGKWGANPILRRHDQYHIGCLDTLLELEEKLLNQGYEGLILRDPNAPYKRGRSTVKEGYLLKLKRFVDAEYEVIGFEERMHNGNVATTNELGRTKRSSHQAGKTGRGDLGALVLRNPTGADFSVGTGFTDDERAAIWSRRDSHLGKIAKVKYFPVGMKDAPRHPVFLGWRDPKDMS